jgi:hypothetical protein
MQEASQPMDSVGIVGVYASPEWMDQEDCKIYRQILCNSRRFIRGHDTPTESPLRHIRGKCRPSTITPRMSRWPGGFTVFIGVQFIPDNQSEARIPFARSGHGMTTSWNVKNCKMTEAGRTPAPELHPDKSTAFLMDTYYLENGIL